MIFGATSRPSKSLSRGAAAEDQALAFLRKQGMSLLTRNYTCKCGELDLVMLDQQTVVFIEVRMRSSNRWGGAAASIGIHKQTRLIKTAQHFLQQHAKFNRHPCRFDVCCIGPDAASGKPGLDWIKSAFSA